MKQIEAIVRPEKVVDVKRALTGLGSGLNVTPVKGHGSQGGASVMWRLKEYTVDLLPKARIVVVVPDGLAAAALEAIVSAARTGRIGDGKIFVSPAAESVRIRTGEQGDDALLGGPDVVELRAVARAAEAEAS
jgi:nitrogen regulatory protein P-II 1